MNLFLATFVVFFTQALAYPWDTKSVEWRSVTDYDTVLLRQDPAGYEKGVKLFLCRVEREQNQVSGKLVFQNGNIRCVVPYRGTEYQSSTFQVLVSYPGVLSWKPSTHTDNYSIFAGWMDSRVTYVCRARFSDNELLIGAIDPTKGTCDVAKAGGEYSTSNRVEVLSKNTFGTATSTTIPKP